MTESVTYAAYNACIARIRQLGDENARLQWDLDLLTRVREADDVWTAVGGVWSCSNQGESAGRNQLFTASLSPGWHVARFITLGNGWGIYSPERWFYVE